MKNTNKLGKQAGQILIIFLLILVVGLAVVLSVASRSITDIRTTTTSDESNRAYFAAEAGIESALKKIQSGAPSTTPDTLDFSAINNTTANVSTKTLDVVSGVKFEFPDEAARDDVKQLNLLTDFNDVVNSSGYSGNNLDVYWGNAGLSGPAPAMLITVLYYNSGTYGLKKFAYDPDSSRTSSNGFCSAVTPDPLAITTTESTGSLDRNFKYKVSVNIKGGVHTGGNCEMDGIGSNKAVLARFRLLYNDDPQPIAVGPESGFNLKPQGSVVISTGSTTSGVTRKLKVTQLYPALPSIFDYVLFSGTDLIK